MSPGAKTAVKVAISWLVILAFVGVWWGLGIALFDFKPTDAKKVMTVKKELATVAGLLSTTVAAGTATALGFELKTKVATMTAPSWWAKLLEAIKIALKPSTLIGVGCIAYAVTGVFIAIAYLSNTDEAPQVIAAFYLAALGWALAAFSSTFKQ